jgi:GNAT superfamily N-acetyltransferase
MPDLRLRLGRPEDAPAVSRLARRVARRWILPEQEESAGQALLQRLGTRALRTDNHLVHFFVGTRWQGRGIARRLWQRTMADALRRAGTRRFTLNATRMAVPVYLRFGFLPSGPEGLSPSGVRTTPMVLEIPPRRRARA